jgi:hypothetical protein
MRQPKQIEMISRTVSMSIAQALNTMVQPLMPMINQLG